MATETSTKGSDRMRATLEGLPFHPMNQNVVLRMDAVEKIRGVAYAPTDAGLIVPVLDGQTPYTVIAAGSKCAEAREGQRVIVNSEAIVRATLDGGETVAHESAIITVVQNASSSSD